MISDGIGFNEKHSYSDFCLLIKARNIGFPERKSIRASVPFQNGFYDFSAINGAPAWGERQIEFVFDLIGNTPQEIEGTMIDITDWLSTAVDVDITDDSMNDYHWHGSIESMKTEYDESGCQCELTATFIVHPFKIANNRSAVTLSVGTHTFSYVGMNVSVIALSTANATVQIGSVAQTILANNPTKLNAEIKRGINTVIIAGSSVTLSFRREML